jgi:hypothetical protein
VAAFTTELEIWRIWEIAFWADPLYFCPTLPTKLHAFRVIKLAFWALHSLCPHKTSEKGFDR